MNTVYIKIITQLKDNYSFVIYSKKNNNSIVVDPAEATSHIKFIKENNLNLHSIYITHHHKDHTAGVTDLLKTFSQTLVYSPDKSIYGTTHILTNNNAISNPINKFQVIITPGHTLDHIIYYDENNGVLFCGDTLFRLGCGRVFEGTLNEMFNSLKKINELSKNTIIYCGHEYTIGNLNFLEKTLKKESAYLTVRKKINDDLNNKGKSVPFLLEDEKQYNLFLNQNSKLGNIIKKELAFTDFELFAYLRKAKASF